MDYNSPIDYLVIRLYARQSSGGKITPDIAVLIAVKRNNTGIAGAGTAGPRIRHRAEKNSPGDPIGLSLEAQDNVQAGD
jgi:hypothetical protein